MSSKETFYQQSIDIETTVSYIHLCLYSVFLIQVYLTYLSVPVVLLQVYLTYIHLCYVLSSYPDVSDKFISVFCTNFSSWCFDIYSSLSFVLLQVSDIKAAIKQLRDQKIRLLSEEPKLGAHGKPVVFVHPKDCCGTLVELEEM